ncbi:hypothetical protein EDB83DRAFT_2392994 [Lactarius deliciosus]|nr:hypothetical protein EDB83DRAFT_2405500 [Lactarius deliciosus]KAH9054622.1 hypothetical protein EDB83DRAFT_2392994 [Lactarius deliciosus]
MRVEMLLGTKELPTEAADTTLVLTTPCLPRTHRSSHIPLRHALDAGNCRPCHVRRLCRRRSPRIAYFNCQKLTWRLTSPVAHSHRELVFEESHALLSSSLLYLEVSRGYATALTVKVTDNWPIVTSSPAESTIKYARASLPRYGASYPSSLLIHYGLMHFNTLSRQWSLSLLVYNVLLDSANTNDELHVLRVSGARGITRSEVSSQRRF